VSEEVLSSVSDKERKRQEAIFELLTSERQYVDSLKLVKQVFFDPMAEQQVLTEQEISKVSSSNSCKQASCINASAESEYSFHQIVLLLIP